MPTAKLTTLTPVHVGSGQRLLRNFDFIVQDGLVGILDVEKVMNKIGIERLPQLTAEIEKKSVGDFLNRVLPNISPMDICSQVVKTKGHITASTGELKLHFRTPLKGPCIPGSSLKGSLRTSMTSYLTGEERKNEAQQRELLRLADWENSRRLNFGKLDSELFGNTANAKSTRFLIVGDIQFTPEDAEVHELSYINQLGDGEWKYESRKLQLVECIRSGASASFQLKLNLEVAEAYRKKRTSLLAYNADDKIMAPLKDLSFFGHNIAGLLSNVNKQTQKLLQWDIDKLEGLNAEPDLIIALTEIQEQVKACTEGEAILRVGGHNGWHFMTGRWMMYKADVFTDEMVDTMMVAAQRNDRYLGHVFPKTRKITDAGLPLGFVKIECT